MSKNTTERLTAQYSKLETSFNQINFVERQAYNDRASVNGEWREWAVSVQHLIELSFGKDSTHAKAFSRLYEKCNASSAEIKGMFAIFKSAKNDFEDDLARDLELTVSGEVLGDFISLAKQAMSENHKDVAAVLASAALEDALKKFADRNEIDVADQEMNAIINALKAKGHFSGAQKSLVSTLPKIRNAALHADWDKISEPEVSALIGFVEQFLVSNF